MKKRLHELKHLFVVAAILITILTAASSAYADCGGRQPGPLEDELLIAIKNPQSSFSITWWPQCLEPDFGSWSGGGSNNLPVVAAAIGLFREPYLGMRIPPSPYNTRTSINYVEWWVKYLGSQLGDLTPAVPKLRYFKGTEPFSNTYDGPVVSSVIAVRYWAQKNGHSQLADYARRYLRANWAIYGMAAGKGPADRYFVDGRTATTSPSQVPALNTEYSPWTPLRTNGGYKYSGHFIALAGARSELSHASSDDKPALYDRAIGYTPQITNENPPQAALLNYLQTQWPTALSESLYALNGTDRSNLNTLRDYGSNAYDFLPWLAKIRTIKTFRVLGWTDYRASIMEGNSNGNTPNMYGVKYGPSESSPNLKLASFLFPWSDRNGAGAPEGWCRLETGRMVASNDPGNDNHPLMQVSVTLPTSMPLFHLVLSQNGEPYFDGTAPTYYPPSKPPLNDWPLNF